MGQAVGELGDDVRQHTAGSASRHEHGIAVDQNALGHLSHEAY